MCLKRETTLADSRYDACVYTISNWKAVRTKALLSKMPETVSLFFCGLQVSLKILKIYVRNGAIGDDWKSDMKPFVSFEP